MQQDKHATIPGKQNVTAACLQVIKFVSSYPCNIQTSKELCRHESTPFLPCINFPSNGGKCHNDIFAKKNNMVKEETITRDEK